LAVSRDRSAAWRRRERGTEQAGAEHGAGRRRDAGHAGHDDRAGNRGDSEREQQAQRHILELVDVGHHATEQLAVAVGLQPGRCQRLDPGEDAGPQAAKGAEGKVVCGQPLPVPGGRPGQGDRADADHDHRQRQDRRLLGGAADEIPGETDQGGAGDDSHGAQANRQGQLAGSEAQQPDQPGKHPERREVIRRPGGVAVRRGGRPDHRTPSATARMSPRS
jgi:hypothetical protein